MLAMAGEGKVVPLYKSTADADGTVPATAMAASVDLSEFPGEANVTIAVILTHSTSGTFSLSLKPREGDVATPDGTWQDGSDATKAIAGNISAGGLGGDGVTFPVRRFRKRYAAIELSGTITATAEIAVVAVVTPKTQN